MLCAGLWFSAFCLGCGGLTAVYLGERDIWSYSSATGVVMSAVNWVELAFWIAGRTICLVDSQVSSFWSVMAAGLVD